MQPSPYNSGLPAPQQLLSKSVIKIKRRSIAVLPGALIDDLPVVAPVYPKTSG